MADKMNVVLSADWERKMIDGLIAMMGERVEKAALDAVARDAGVIALDALADALAHRLQRDRSEPLAVAFTGQIIETV